MSFYDDASLVFLPSGGAGKDTKAYSIKPTNGDGDFTFSRGSNLTATRVDSNGLIEKGRENLLLQSNSFDTTWTTSGSSVTSGQSGYDGSLDAWLLESNNTSGAYIYQNLTASGVQTFSVYAKAGTCDFIYFVVRGSTNIASYFDLENGTIGTAVATNIDRKIESVGSGWYRCSITLSNTDTSVRIYMADADGSTISAVGSNIYIQDAQVEIGLIATEPIESGASTGLAGILEDSPRFDYSGGASCPSLLLEPSRTNSFDYSEYFEDSKLGEVTLTTNAIVSPEGLQNASLVVCPSGRLGENVSLTNGTDYVVSVFAKQKGQTFNIRAADGTNPNVQFNLATQTTTDTNGAVGSMEDYGNGWYRCIMKFTASATGSFEIRYVLITDADGVYAYGAQVEEGSYPTSYIPNHSGGSVTREADVCGGAGTSSTFNDDEGVLYLEASAIDNGSSEKAIAINDGTTNNRINIRIVNNTIKGLVILSGSLVCNISYTAPSVITSNKIAFKYKRNDFALWVNGVEVGTDTSGSAFLANTLNELSFDYGGSSAFFYGNVKQVIYFPSLLSDVELIALTS